MVKKHPGYRIFYKVVYALTLLLLALYLLTFTDLKAFLQKQDQRTAIYTSGGWTTGEGVSVNTDEISAQKFGGAVLLRKTLPSKLGHNDSLCFASNNARITVWINGEIVYRYNSTKNLTGTGYGVAHHIISLTPEDAGAVVQIGMVSVFDNHGGGRILGIRICPATTYVHLLVREQLAACLLSALVVFFGMVLIALHIGLARKNNLPYNLAALGTAMLLMGCWCLVDTGIPQLLTGSVIASRVLDYTLLHLVSYPLVCFVSSMTKQKRPIYLHLSFCASAVCVTLLLLLRLTAGRDMHELVGLLYVSYFFPGILIVAMLLDNRIYCRRAGVAVNLRHFAVGTGVLTVCGAIDIVLYLFGLNSAIQHARFLRFGLCFFMAEMLLQLLHWWSNERTSIERDRFVNRLLQYAMSDEDPEKSLNAALEYLGRNLLADRAYIFEDMRDGTFDNTYEWCRAGVTPEIDNLKGLPYDGVIDVWYNEYKRANHILIYDIEAYRAVSENMYNVLKPQGIRTLVTGPLEVNGEYIGFFGVDNPPEEMMQEVSEIMRLLSYFLSQLILRRDGQNRLIRYSYYDAMTGVKNRRAYGELEKAGLPPNSPFGFVMCDINGLKRVNDTKGHEAGDAMIVDVANSLTDVFGPKNVYRIGGDEFVVFVPHGSEVELIANVAKARTTIMEKGYSASFGYVFSTSQTPDIKVAKAKADAQMYTDKEHFYRGRNDRRKR